MESTGPAACSLPKKSTQGCYASLPVCESEWMWVGACPPPHRTFALIPLRRTVLLRSPLGHTCRDHRPDFSATLTTVAFDRSSLRGFGISEAEPEGSSIISIPSTVTQRRFEPALLVAQGTEPPTSASQPVVSYLSTGDVIGRCSNDACDPS